jgi:hypothetical protein
MSVLKITLVERTATLSLRKTTTEEVIRRQFFEESVAFVKTSVVIIVKKFRNIEGAPAYSLEGSIKYKRKRCWSAKQAERGPIVTK